MYMQRKYKINKYSALFSSGWILVLAVLILGFHSPIKAQVNPEAKLIYQSYLNDLESGNYDSLHIKLKKSYELEYGEEERDFSFLAQVLYGLGEQWDETEDATHATNYYLISMNILESIGEIENAAEVAQSLADYLNAREEEHYLFNGLDSLAQNFEYDTIKTIFSCVKVIESNSSSARIEINGGLNQGVFLGSVGAGLTYYDASNLSRESKNLGTIKVIQVKNTTCIAQLTYSTEYEKPYIPQERDHMEIQTRRNESAFNGIISQLAAKNIYFLDGESKLLVDKTLHNYMTSSLYERMMLFNMLTDIHDVGDFLAEFEAPDPAWTEKLMSGRFEDQTIISLLQNATSADLLMFLEFVNDFPYKYLGGNFKLSETFATWAINNTPWPEETLLLMDDLMARYQENPAELGKNYSWYLRHQYYLIDHWSTKLNGEYFSNGFNAADSLCNFYIEVGKNSGYDSLYQNFIIAKGSLLVSEEKYEESIPYFTQGIDLGIWKLNGYWFRGNANYHLEMNQKAINDYDSVITHAPEFADAYGNKGATLIKMAKWKDASVPILKAYELDSSSSTWSLNLAHAYLFRDMEDSASYFYLKTMNLISSEAIFQNGPIADFDFFIENGRRENLCKKYKDKVMNLWNTKYKNIILSKEHFNNAVVLKDQGDYTEAISEFRTCLIEENKIVKKDNIRLRNIERWLAFCNYKIQDYKNSLVHYKNGLMLALNFNDEEIIISDYDDIGNIYSWMGDKVNEEIYDNLEAALQYDMDEASKSRQVHYFGFQSGTEKAEPFAYTQNDLNIISKLIKNKSLGAYDSSSVFIVNNPTKELFKTNIEDCISGINRNDFFILHFSGRSFRTPYSKGLILGKDSLTLDELFGFLSYVPADRFLLIADCPNINIHSAYSAYRESHDLNRKNQFCIIEPEIIRVEQDSLKHSLMTEALIKALEGKGMSIDSDNKLSARELLQVVSSNYKVHGGYLGLIAHLEGKDFPIVTLASRINGTDVLAPSLQIFSSTSGSRGTVVEEMTNNIAVISGMATDESGLDKIMVNGMVIDFSPTGKFHTDVSVAKGQRWIHVSAIDKKGNAARDSIPVSFEESQKSSEDLVNSMGKDYALLIATDEYTNFGNLKNPIYDAEEIAKLLQKKYGFEAEILKNPTRKEIKLKLVEYAKKDYGSRDQLLIFIAGHGEYHPMFQAQLVCKDTRRDDELNDSYIPFHNFTTIWDNTNKCNNVFLVLDVCFGGSFFEKEDENKYVAKFTSESEKNKFITKTRGIKTRLFLTSGGKEYVPDGRPGAHSPFASKFIEALNTNGDGKGFLGLQDITRHIKTVPTTPKYGPLKNNGQGGDFIFQYKVENSEVAVSTNKQDLKATTSFSSGK